MRVTTESGAVYEFSGDRVRRVNESHVKRADGDWVRLVTMFPKTPEVGSSMELVLDSLASYGPDDYGTRSPGATTTRVTTRVVEVTA